jgi:2-furoyl-CoA dehydrogenase large subunit
MKLEKSGRIAVVLGSPSCGQSHETAAAQIAAEILGIEPEHVSVATPFDSVVSPWGVSASNSGNNFHLYDVGAVHGAATRLRERVLTLAAHLLKSNKENLVIDEGTVRDSKTVDKEITFAELGKIAYGNQSLLPDGFEPGLQTTYYHSFPHADPMMVPDAQGRVRAQYTFSAAAHAAVVEVDRATGRVRVLRYVIVSDNGTLIHPDVVDGQIYGSAAHGISVALGEGFVYDAEGQLMTLTLLDYGKSTTLETPEVEIEHHPVPDPFTTLGQKAAGEGAAIPSPAAIASAVEDALQPFGARVEELPLSPERVWHLMRQNQKAGAPA